VVNPVNVAGHSTGNRAIRSFASAVGLITRTEPAALPLGGIVTGCHRRAGQAPGRRSSGAYPGMVHKTRLKVAPASWWRFPGIATAALRLLAVGLSGYAVRPCPSAGLQASC
jgi:hypothetical protein